MRTQTGASWGVNCKLVRLSVSMLGKQNTGAHPSFPSDLLLGQHEMCAQRSDHMDRLTMTHFTFWCLYFFKWGRITFCWCCYPTQQTHDAQQCIWKYSPMSHIITKQNHKNTVFVTLLSPQIETVPSKVGCLQKTAHLQKIQSTQANSIFM